MKISKPLSKFFITHTHSAPTAMCCSPLPPPPSFHTGGEEKGGGDTLLRRSSCVLWQLVASRQSPVPESCLLQEYTLDSSLSLSRRDASPWLHFAKGEGKVIWSGEAKAIEIRVRPQRKPSQLSVCIYIFVSTIYTCTRVLFIEKKTKSAPV